jgi:hypothetical protein
MNTHTFRDCRMGLLGIAAFSLFAAPAVHAGAITFNATGTLADGATLSGFVVIDTATGVVQSANLSVSSPLSLSGITLNSSLGGQGSGAYSLFAGGPPLDIILDLPVTTLIGYTGGNLCLSSCAGLNSSVSAAQNFTNSSNFTSGSLTAVPEPGSLALGIAGAGLLMWKRGRRAART